MAPAPLPHADVAFVNEEVETVDYYTLESPFFVYGVHSEVGFPTSAMAPRPTQVSSDVVGFEQRYGPSGTKPVVAITGQALRRLGQLCTGLGCFRDQTRSGVFVVVWP